MVLTSDTSRPGFYEILPDLGTNGDRAAVRHSAETLHKAIGKLDLAAIRQSVAPWHVHLYRDGRHHYLDDWLAFLQRQPERRRATSAVIGEITIADSMAFVRGYSRVASNVVLDDVAAAGEISRFTQLWANVSGVWLRTCSRSSPRDANVAKAP